MQFLVPGAWFLDWLARYASGEGGIWTVGELGNLSSVPKGYPDKRK